MLMHASMLIFCVIFSIRLCIMKREYTIYVFIWRGMLPPPNSALEFTWRYCAWFSSEDDHIWPLTLHFDFSKVLRDPDLGWSHIYLKAAILAVWGFLEVLRPMCCSLFTHRTINSASWPLPMPIRAIDPVCPQMIFPVIVTFSLQECAMSPQIFNPDTVVNSMSFYS